MKRYSLLFFICHFFTFPVYAADVDLEYYCAGDVVYHAGYSSILGTGDGSGTRTYASSLEAKVGFWIDSEGRVRSSYDGDDSMNGSAFSRLDGLGKVDIIATQVDSDSETEYSEFARDPIVNVGFVGGTIDLETGNYRLGLFSPTAQESADFLTIYGVQYTQHFDPPSQNTIPFTDPYGTTFFEYGCPIGESNGVSWSPGADTAVDQYFCAKHTTPLSHSVTCNADSQPVASAPGVPPPPAPPCPVCGWFGTWEKVADDVYHLEGAGQGRHWDEIAAINTEWEIENRNYDEYSTSYTWDVTCAPLAIVLDSNGEYVEELKYETDKQDQIQDFQPGRVPEFMEPGSVETLIPAEMPHIVRVCVEAMDDSFIGSTVQFELDEEKTTSFPGITGNWPLPDEAGYVPKIDYVILDKEVPIGENHIACSKVEAWDYGGFARVKATVLSPGRPEFPLELNMPVDRDENQIADIDPFNSKCANPSEDSDNLNQWHTALGDGWSCAEERRGIVTQEGLYTQLDPEVKDLLIAHLTDTSSGSGFFTLETIGVQVHEVLPEQLPDRVANFNAGPRHIQTQHGVKINVGECDPTDSTCAGVANVITLSEPWTPGNIRDVVLDDDHWPFASETVKAWILGHELGHTVDIRHHGDKDKTVDEEYIAVEGGQHSGDQSCVMRYYSAAFEYEKNQELYYYFPVIAVNDVTGQLTFDKSEEQPGQSFCGSPEGTNTNSGPERLRDPDATGEQASLAKTYDAVQGNCKTKARVKDPQ